MFQYEEKISADGKPMRVYKDNYPYKCYRTVRRLIKANGFVEKLELPNRRLPEFEITAKYSEFSPEISIRVFWDQDDYDKPPSKMEVSAMTDDGVCLERYIPITDFKKDMQEVLTLLVEMGALENWEE